MERPQRSKFSFIITEKRNGKTPERKRAGAQPSDKKSEEISERPDAASQTKDSKWQEGKWQTLCKLGMVQRTWENQGKWI